MMDLPPPEPVDYYSDGLHIDALFFRPPVAQDNGGQMPAVVFCPGSRVTKDTPYYQDYVRRLAAGGVGVLLIDYRGWGGSEGEPGRLFPLEQVADIRNGVTYLQNRPDVAPDELGLFGVSMGGAHAVYAAAIDDRIRAAVAVLSPLDGADFLRRARRGYEWQELLAQVRADRLERVRTGVGKTVPSLYPAIPEQRASPFPALKDAPPIPLACIDAILEYRPLDVVGRISPRSLLLITADEDPLCPPEHSRLAYDIAGPSKKLIELAASDHYRTYVDFADLILRESSSWLDRYLSRPPPREVSIG
jgi:pimeloyl-ACP methyl ester carboxylesterase